jgi:hypothetical protein
MELQEHLGVTIFFFNVPFVQKYIKIIYIFLFFLTWPKTRLQPFMVEIGQTYCFNPPSILIYLSKEKWQK